VEALCTAGKYKEALPKLQAFVNKGVANSKVRLYLGHAYYQTKQYKKALSEFRWVEKNSPLISVRRDAEGAAFSLECYLKGVCPGRCLKANAAGWQRLAGHPANELWMTFPFKGGSQSWSTRHIGEVIVYERGRPVNKGKCPICKGTGRVTPLK
jgi:tetratricopeptide (TPR) repeat protein